MQRRGLPVVECDFGGTGDRLWYIHMMQVLTVQTPYKEEDMAALCDKLYCCPQLRLFVLESDQPLTADWVLCI